MEFYKNRLDSLISDASKPSPIFLIFSSVFEVSDAEATGEREIWLADVGSDSFASRLINATYVAYTGWTVISDTAYISDDFADFLTDFANVPEYGRFTTGTLSEYEAVLTMLGLS